MQNKIHHVSPFLSTIFTLVFRRITEINCFYYEDSPEHIIQINGYSTAKKVDKGGKPSESTSYLFFSELCSVISHVMCYCEQTLDNILLIRKEELSTFRSV